MPQAFLWIVRQQQRDPSRVTEQRACHAAGISLGQRGQRDPSRVTKHIALSFRRNLSAERAEQRDPYGVTEPRVCHAVGISLGARRAETAPNGGSPLDAE